MIKVKSKINIKSGEQEIWSFLNNISLGLSFNRIHKKIHIQNSFSINVEKEMIIEHNFGFGTYDMVLKVIDSLPNNKIVFEEKSKKKEDQLFNHKMVENEQWYTKFIIFFKNVMETVTKKDHLLYFGVSVVIIGILTNFIIVSS